MTLPAPVTVVIAVLAAWLGAHFAVLLLGTAAVAVLTVLGILTDRITVTVLRTGWRTVPGVLAR